MELKSNSQGKGNQEEVLQNVAILTMPTFTHSWPTDDITMVRKIFPALIFTSVEYRMLSELMEILFLLQYLYEFFLKNHSGISCVLAFY